MKFVKVEKFKLMHIGTTMNGLEITEEAAIKAVKSFYGKPIIYNENQNLRDYRNNDEVNSYYKDRCIGVILPETVGGKDGYVFGDVMLLEEFANKTEYDNWLIQYEDGDFTYCACEIF